MVKEENPGTVELLLTYNNIKLKEKDIDIINKYYGENNIYGENKKIMNLLIEYKERKNLTNANDAFENKSKLSACILI